MAIEINGITYRNLSEQVAKNQEDIAAIRKRIPINEDVELIEEQIGDLQSQISELNQEAAKALKTPMVAPATTELVGVGTSGAQEMVQLGEYLAYVDGQILVKPPIIVMITTQDQVAPSYITLKYSGTNGYRIQSNINPITVLPQGISAIRLIDPNGILTAYQYDNKGKLLKMDSTGETDIVVLQAATATLIFN